MWNGTHTVNSRFRVAGPWQATKSTALATAWILSLGVALQSWVWADDEEAAAEVAEQRLPLPKQHFEQLVYGYQRWVPVSDGVQRLVAVEHPTVADFRRHIEDELAAEIRIIDTRLSLTKPQTKKLQLAARGDIADYINRVEVLCPKLTSKPLDQQEYMRLMQEMWLLRMSCEIGLLGQKSLFQKTLRAMLTDEQRVRFQTLERERQATVIEAAIQKMECTNDGMTLAGETRGKFAELILKHGNMPQNVGRYGRFVLILEANLLRDRIKPLLTETEWTEFETQVGMAKRVEQTLKVYGIWPARRSQAEGQEQETDDELKGGR